MRLNVLGLEVKHWPPSSAQATQQPFYVVAHMEIVNKDDRAIEFAGYDMPNSPQPHYDLHYRSTDGWSQTPGWHRGTGVKAFKLEPSKRVLFDAVVTSDKPCNVTLDYTDGRPQSRLESYESGLLSGWIGLPVTVGTGARTIHSRVIDPRRSLKDEIDAELFRVAKAAHLAEIRGGSEFRLAGKYWVGDGVERNRTKAIELYQVAATKGNAEAAYNLANIYEHGLGVTVNWEVAGKLYRQASDTGHVPARERLDRLLAKQKSVSAARTSR